MKQFYTTFKPLLDMGLSYDPEYNTTNMLVFIDPTIVITQGNRSAQLRYGLTPDGWLRRIFIFQYELINPIQTHYVGTSGKQNEFKVTARMPIRNAECAIERVRKIAEAYRTKRPGTIDKPFNHVLHGGGYNVRPVHKFYAWVGTA